MTRTFFLATLMLSLAGCASGGGGVSFDAGPGLDAGSDGGRLDAATDSAVTDSSATDSGVVDSSVVDSGAADSGATDSGATDSGATDSGATDSGATDSGCTPGSCDDGDPCNGTETCVAGECMPGTPMDCSDGVACTVDGCTAGSCTHTPDSTMCLGGLTCDATRGCIDPSCAESPCRLISPQCGCGTGEGCYLNTSGVRVCAVAGSVPEGGSCDADLCAPGTGCVNVSTTATDIGLCKRWCASDADCTGGPGSLCITSLTGTSERVCTSSCDVISQSGCSATTFCSIYEEMGTGRRLTDCQGPVGLGGQGAACVDDSSCQRGFACIDVGGGVRNCLRWCRRTPAPMVSDCASVGAGLSCFRLGSAPGLVFNGTEYGVCSS